MEQLIKKVVIKTSHSLDDITALRDLKSKKNNKSKNASFVKDEQKNDTQYDIIATSIVNDIEDKSYFDTDNTDIENSDLPTRIPVTQKKKNNKQKSEPNLMSSKLKTCIVIEKTNILEEDDKNIKPELNVNDIPIKSCLIENDSSNNMSANNLSFSGHCKNESVSSNNGRGYDNNGNGDRVMQDENNYKEDNNSSDKKKGKESQVIIEEISAERFFELLDSSNISKINENSNNNNENYNILIFDFRMFSEFKNEYISNSINVNIPSLILNRSMKYQYTNFFNIQNFVSENDKLIIQQWILNNYKIDQNKNLNSNTKPLIIVYDDQNIMDTDICCSPVKTVLKYLEVQHIIALNELKYYPVLSNDKSNSITDNSQSSSTMDSDVNDYLLNKQLYVAWVTGGYDAISTHSESKNYILNDKTKDQNISIFISQPDEAPCGTPLTLKPTLGLGIHDDSSNMECSTPIDGKACNFNNIINDATNNNLNNKPNLALSMLNKKNKSNKQKLTLNINCATSNNPDECKTPLSAIPNSNEPLTLQPRISTKQQNNSLSLTIGSDDDNPKNHRRKKSSLLISVNNLEKKTDHPVPQIQPNGMLAVVNYRRNYLKPRNLDGDTTSYSHKDLPYINRINNSSPSSDLPVNISPTTSTIIPHYTKVLPYLYIGTETIPASVNAIERLKKLKVTHVLNVATECNVSVTFPEDQIVYKKIDLADNLAENIAKYLWESSEWIENERKKNNNAVFYIHCKAGKSRSATVVIAYLMKVEHWSLNKAYTYLKDLRPNISPNLGFMSALLEMEAEIKKQDEEKANVENGNKDMNISSSDNNITN